MLKIKLSSLTLLLTTGSTEIPLLNKSNSLSLKVEEILKNAHLILHLWLMILVVPVLKKLPSTILKLESVVFVKEPLSTLIKKENVYKLAVVEAIIITLIKENVSVLWLNLTKQQMENVSPAYCQDSGINKPTLVIAALNLQFMFQLKTDVLHAPQINLSQLDSNV